MKNWKGTKGEVFSVVSDIDYSGNYTVRCDNRGVTFGEDEHNAKLFADALNTINKCDLMPSELLKERDELLEALKYISSANKGDEISFKRKGDQIEHLKQVIGHICNMADKLIKQIEG